MTVDTSNHSIEPKKKAIRVKFIDGNRSSDDKSPWPTTSAVAFIDASGDGVSILFKERPTFQPGDVLNIKFSDTYGGENKPLEEA